MIPEEVFYFFIYPWILVIAGIPGLVFTFIGVGVVAQLLNYFPQKKEPLGETQS